MGTGTTVDCSSIYAPLTKYSNLLFFTGQCPSDVIVELNVDTMIFTLYDLSGIIGTPTFLVINYQSSR